MHADVKTFLLNAIKTVGFAFSDIQRDASFCA